MGILLPAFPFEGPLLVKAATFQKFFLFIFGSQTGRILVSGVRNGAIKTTIAGGDHSWKTSFKWKTW
jgi:hypothetical protein